jgi:di/tricarboxylate transporter
LLQSHQLKIGYIPVGYFYRKSGRIASDFEQVRISVGDTLLLKGPEEELQRLMYDDDLINLTIPALDPYKRGKAPLAIIGIVGAIGLATAGLMPIAGSAMLGAVFVLATGCLQMHQAYKSLRGEVLLLIYGMLMVSIALKKTGALALVVTGVMQMSAGLPPVVILSLLYLMTSILTETLSNNAVAVVLTPVAIAIAQQLGVNPAAFAAAIMFGASASFATPVGYQTNTLVFNAGGYRFSDFVRVGVPMNLLIWALATVLIPVFWPL